MLNAAHLVVRLIFRTGDQQLIAALARLTLKIVSNTGIAGIFQIGNHQTNRTRASCTQAGSDRIRMVVVLTNDGHHLFDRFVADAVLFRFTVNHIASGGTRDTGQPGDFIQFHNCPLGNEYRT